MQADFRCSLPQELVEATYVGIVFISGLRNPVDTNRIPFCHQNAADLNPDPTRRRFVEHVAILSGPAERRTRCQPHYVKGFRLRFHRTGCDVRFPSIGRTGGDGYPTRRVRVRNRISRSNASPIVHAAMIPGSTASPAKSDLETAETLSGSRVWPCNGKNRSPQQRSVSRVPGNQKGPRELAPDVLERFAASFDLLQTPGPQPGLVRPREG